MRELHLFAGIGGGILAGKLLGHRCVGAVEIDSYCRSVLEERQRQGLLEEFPIHDDIRTFDAKPWRGSVDIVCGGFPCQPWSQAGKRRGSADERHLWPEMARIVAECRPRFVFAENVSLAAFAEPWRDLRGMGYRVPPALCLAAEDVGAPHLRKRWWLLAADSNGDPLRDKPWGSEPRGASASITGHDGQAQQVADSDRRGREGERQPEPRGVEGACRSQPDGRGAVRELEDAASTDSSGAGLPLPEQDGCGWEGPSRRYQEWQATAECDWWSVEPDVGRVAHGVPHRVDQLRALGNAQVPAQAARAFRILMDALG